MTNHVSPDLTNKVIAGYTILHRLGVGGMSEVYLAFQQSLMRHVALKVMRSDYVGSADHEQRFIQEARAAAALMHPNIVQVYDVGTFESVHYIAQEYVPGSNLHAYIQRRGALPLPESLSILWQSASALRKAAAMGIVHRDIKPDNLLLTPEGEVKVADFGLARANGQSLNLTAVGITLGTPLYMSPEQVQGTEVDARSDLYSLGATAYHMLSGRPPFSGDTPLALALQHVQAKPSPLSSLRPDLPNELSHIVHKLLEKSPDDRFANGKELADALKRIIDTSIGADIDKMIPFSGLVIEHQRVSNLRATQELQQIVTDEKQKTTDSLASPAVRSFPWKRAAVHTLVYTSLILLTMGIVYSATYRDVFHTQLNADPVRKEDSVEKQFATALVENDLQHWNAVFTYFPPDKDAKYESYYHKSILQIARKHIDAESDLEARDILDRILLDPSPRIDPVVLAIAHIEKGYLERKLSGDAARANMSFEEADRILQSMEEQKEKRHLVLESLPKSIRLTWEQRSVQNPS